MSTQAELLLIGPDTLDILWKLVNVMNRCDPLYCNGHMQEPCTDSEWDEALSAAEDELNRLGIAPHPPGVLPT